jgi:hypothetical protein
MISLGANTSLKEMRESGIYEAYSKDFKPFYYVTTTGDFLCAWCATENYIECNIPHSNMYINYMAMNINSELKCDCCKCKIEKNRDFYNARQLYKLTKEDTESIIT